MSHTLPLFLAHAPTTVTPALPRPFTPVPMAYQTAPDGQLFRAGQGTLPAGWLLPLPLGWTGFVGRCWRSVRHSRQQACWPTGRRRRTGSRWRNGWQGC